MEGFYTVSAIILLRRIYSSLKSHGKSIAVFLARSSLIYYVKCQKGVCVWDMTNSFQHYLNPLHVYCRLRDLRVPKGVAILLCKFYERAIFNHFSGRYRMC